MTMIQENPASDRDDQSEVAAHVEDPNTEANHVPGYQHWCPLCYIEGTDRLIQGFTITHNRPGFPPSVVPPLSPGAALSLRHARDAVITRRADYPSEAAQHGRHPGVH
jgi:hypothetical protein